MPLTNLLTRPVARTNLGPWNRLARPGSQAGTGSELTNISGRQGNSIPIITEPQNRPTSSNDAPSQSPVQDEPANSIDALVSSFLDQLSALSLELSEPRNPAAIEAPQATVSVSAPDKEAPVELRRYVEFPRSPDLFESSAIDELTFEEAADLFLGIARSERNATMISFLQTARGQVRVRTVLHLSGGNRHSFAGFAALFARESPEAPIELLIRKIDERVGRPGERPIVYDSMRALDQEDAAVLLLRAWALYRTGNYRDALSLCDKSIQLDPDRTHAWCYRGLILLGLGRAEEALHSCEQANDLDRADSFAWAARGTALAELGVSHEALAALEQSISMGEDAPAVHFKRAQVLLALDRWREGIALLDEALRRFARSNDPFAGDTRGMVRSLLASLSSPGTLQHSTKALLLVYRKYQAMAALGQGLIECIPDILSPALSHEDAGRWLDSWRAAAEGVSQLQTAVRFLDYAVRYRRTPDTRVFTDLPKEERIALERLIGLDIEAIA